MFAGLVDAHVHADGLGDEDLETLVRFGVERVLVCAHDGLVDRGEPTAAAWVRQFERLLGPESIRLRKHGLRPLFALGVHPSHAPWRGLEELFHALPTFLSDPSVVAIGTLGLKSGDDRERDLLTRQLELARDLRRPALVAAPPLAPEAGLRPLANLVLATGLDPARVLVEHLTPTMVNPLRAFGFTLALEVSPGRLSEADAVGLVRRYGPRGFVLTSHAGEGAANMLAVPMLAARLVDAGLSRDVVLRVARDNALRFLGREDARRAARTA